MKNSENKRTEYTSDFINGVKEVYNNKKIKLLLYGAGIILLFIVGGRIIKVIGKSCTDYACGISNIKASLNK